MRLHYNPRKWHYVPDAPSLTWGPADDRARLRAKAGVDASPERAYVGGGAAACASVGVLTASNTAYLDLLGDIYGARMGWLDFADAQQSRLTINNWVSDRTSGHIEHLIAPGS